MNKVETEPDYCRISPTARVLAYLRSFSEIAYAEQVSVACRGEETTRQLFGDDFEEAKELAGPFAEARYRCFDRFIRNHTNVLELAVGTSIERGVSITNDASKIYVGTDLPAVLEESRQLCSRIAPVPRSNHHLAAANALVYEQLVEAAEPFEANGAEVLILNEGLWGYFDTEEKRRAADNMRRMLQRYGGIWVTPDIADLHARNAVWSSLGVEARALLSRLEQKFSTLSGRSLENNFFPTEGEALSFLRSCGLDASRHPMVERMEDLSSIHMWGQMQREQYGPGLRRQHVWVMSLR